MSRWIDVDLEKRTRIEEIASMDECLHLINDMCCNENSEMLGGYTHPSYCHKKCPWFQEEDGIITE